MDAFVQIVLKSFINQTLTTVMLTSWLLIQGGFAPIIMFMLAKVAKDIQTQHIDNAMHACI